MLPPPPRSTLFPYTTLFRSQTLKAGVMEIADVYVVNKSDRPGADTLRQEVEVMLGIRRGNAFRDRKSTRLNSSHVSISYAVFCLKKKTYQDDAPAGFPESWH